MDRLAIKLPTVSNSPWKGKPCPPGRTRKRDGCIPKSELGSEKLSAEETVPEVPVQEAPEKHPAGNAPSAAEDYRQNGTRSKSFKSWFGDWENDPDNSSKAINPETGEPDETSPFSHAVDDDGEPIIVFHGTTHEFREFDPAKAHQLNHIGNGFYFSSDVGDSDSNYAGEGPDLRERVSILAEQIESDLENGSYEDWMSDEEWEEAQEEGDFRDRAKEIARGNLVGKTPKVMEVYLNLRKPVILGGDRDTYFGMEFPTIEDEEGNEDYDYEEPSGLAVDFINALREAVEDYTKEGFDPLDAGTIIEQMRLWDNPDGMGAKKLVKAFFNSEEAGYASKEDPNTGRSEILVGQLLNDVFRKMGFDGVIYNDAHDWFPNMVKPGTRHYIAFHPEQIKSVDNEGSFDPKQRDIYKRLKALRLMYRARKYGKG